MTSHGPLELHDVRMVFGKVTALDSITTTFGEPGITGIIGPNGSGKTTLAHIVSGVLRRTAGRVLWHGRDIGRLPAHRVARLGISRTFQHSMTFSDLSVEENLVIALEAAGRRGSEVGEYVAEGTLYPALGAYRAERAGDLPFGIDRLLGVALATVRRPSLLILDEPAAGLNDLETEALATTVRAIASEGPSVAIIDHDMAFLLPLCQRVVVLDAGSVIADAPPDEVRRDPRVIATYLGDGVAQR